MAFFIKFVCMLALVRLALTQQQLTQTTLTCLSDGQCITDTGEDAVCGKIDRFGNAKLPTVGGDFDEYVIRIDLNEPLEEDLNEPLDEDASCDPSQDLCPVEPSQNDTDVTIESQIGDRRNPSLGGVGCELPAFRKACQKCCVQTNVVLGRRSSEINVDIEKGGEQNDNDEKCIPQEEHNDQEDQKQARAARAGNCIERQPLGFYRNPRRRFFSRCNALSRRICGRGLARCVDLRRR